MTTDFQTPNGLAHHIRLIPHFVFFSKLEEVLWKQTRSM